MSGEITRKMVRIKKRLFGSLFLPFSMKCLRDVLAVPGVRVLDVGCGNHSVSILKEWFPECEYHGIDRALYNIDDTDLGKMKRFYELDLTTSTLSEIPDGYFDVILCSHVIEHLKNGLEVLERLSGKVRASGTVYVEFPSVRSLSLPSATDTLNFCDDPTHVRLYDLKELGNLFLGRGFRIRRAGVRRDFIRILVFFLTIPLQVLALLRTGKLVARRGLWDVTGFADYLVAERINNARQE
jgi:hypothetical protein